MLTAFGNSKRSSSARPRMELVGSEPKDINQMSPSHSPAAPSVSTSTRLLAKRRAPSTASLRPRRDPADSPEHVSKHAQTLATRPRTSSPAPATHPREAERDSQQSAPSWLSAGTTEPEWSGWPRFQPSVQTPPLGLAPPPQGQG